MSIEQGLVAKRPEFLTPEAEAKVVELVGVYEGILRVACGIDQEYNWGGVLTVTFLDAPETLGKFLRSIPLSEPPYIVKSFHDRIFPRE